MKYEIKLYKSLKYVKYIILSFIFIFMSSSTNIGMDLDEVEAVELKTIQEQKIKVLSSIPSGYPTELKSISSTFGYRIHPIYQKKKMHKGIDIPVSVGTPVLSTSYGKCIFSGYKNGYGMTVKIKSGDFVTLYAHLSKLLVKNGQMVSLKDTIALSGNTGNSTGPHLHYEVHLKRNNVNRAVDPIDYMK